MKYPFQLTSTPNKFDLYFEDSTGILDPLQLFLPEDAESPAEESSFPGIIRMKRLEIEN
jgi:hypothetical protein